nr:type I-E CRISPR-associated endoribonuclease Cas2e [uncultured Celeribacter sp.]
MALTLIVTRDVQARYRGFLTSVMLEISPGVYVAPDMTTGVRTRVWGVISEWWDSLRQGSVTLVWRDTTATGHLRIETLGEPPKHIVDADGVLLVKRK